jgi:hypothetical protein
MKPDQRKLSRKTVGTAEMKKPAKAGFFMGVA